MTVLQTSHRLTKEGNGQKKGNGFSFFLILSCLIHALLILFLAIIFAKHLLQGTKNSPDKEPPPPEVILEITPPSKNERPFVEAKELVDKAPENSPFQSDQNTKAASELAPSGSIPLPSQEGLQQSALELQNQRHTQGEKAALNAGNPTPAQPPSAPPTASQQLLPLKSAPMPQPTATPFTSSTPQSTPTPSPSDIKLSQPQKQSPPQTSTTTQTAAPQSQQLPPRQTSASGSSGATKGYQPETHQTVIRGNISNRGRSSVAAQATPLGRYRKAVADAIGSRWYYYVEERMGFLSIGNVDVSFKVNSNGKVSGLHIISVNGNQSLTECSLRSIMDAKLPPIPSDVVATLQDGVLEIDYSFTIY